MRLRRRPAKCPSRRPGRSPSPTAGPWPDRRPPPRPGRGQGRRRCRATPARGCRACSSCPSSCGRCPWPRRPRRRAEAAAVGGQARGQLEQALVDRAQFLGLHVAPVDRDEAGRLPQPGEPVDRLHQVAVGEAGAPPDRADRPRLEQPAERRQAEARLPTRERPRTRSAAPPTDRGAGPMPRAGRPGRAAGRRNSPRRRACARPAGVVRRVQQVAVLGREQKKISR